MGRLSEVTLATVTRDPFCHPWKRADRYLTEAANRGWDIVVGLDRRTCEPCMRQLLLILSKAPRAQVLRFLPVQESCDEMLEEVVHTTRSKRVLLVSDDEEPSPALWALAQKPPIEANWAIQMVCPLPDLRLYAPGTEIQMRLLNPKTWHWVGGLGGYDDNGGNAASAIHAILWHFACWAPRDYREAKMISYQKLGATPEYGRRHFWEEHQDETVPMTPALRAQFPELLEAMK